MVPVRFQVLMAVSMKKTAFWDMVPCSLVDVDHITVCTPKTAIYFYKTAWRHIPEGSHLPCSMFCYATIIQHEKNVSDNKKL
jgi:hypothetical protein